MSSGRGGSVFVRWYRNRIGEPSNSDEVYGYWIFALGIVLAVVGFLWYALNTGGGPSDRLLGYVLAGGGVVLLFGGSVYRLPLGRLATGLTYLGGILGLAAIAWFTTIFPSGWVIGGPTANLVIFLYLAGLAVMAAGAVLVPIIPGRAEQESEERGREIDRLREELQEREATVEELRTRLDEAETEAADREEDVRGDREELERTLGAVREERDALERELEAAREAEAASGERVTVAELRLAEIQNSQGTFELYTDAGGQWRWRLVHRNGNIIGTSGEGYRSDRSARRGMRSVQRNAPGATVVWLEPEADDDEPVPDPDPTPVYEPEEVRSSVELYEDTGGEWRWRLVHDNGNIIATGARGYASRRNAVKGLGRSRELVAPGDYLSFDPAGFEVYEDAGGEWRWRLVHRNGNIIGDSSEGYAARSGAIKAVDRFKDRVADAPVNPDDGPDPVAFELYEDAGGEWRWRLVHRNGNTLADSGEGYTERREAENAIDRVKRYGPEADTLTVGAAAFELFEDEAGEHRWRLRHRNGTLLARASEGYASRSNAIANINSVKRNLPHAPGGDRTEGDTGEGGVSS
jgi:uncharacterized protein YegP (UPF0339 family)